MIINKEVFLRGKKICLRALNESDVEGNYSSWFNDTAITEYNSHGRFPMTPPQLFEYVKRVHQSKTDLILAVVDSESGKHIGNASLQNVNWIDRNAEIAFLLGEKSFWGRGVMFEAGSLLIQHAFNSLNLHRIYCGTSAMNLGMQKLALKLGMKQEGIRKEALFKKGTYFDILEYGILNRV